MPAASILDARIRQRLGDNGTLIHYTQRYSDQSVIGIEVKKRGAIKIISNPSIQITAVVKVYPSLNVDANGIPSILSGQPIESTAEFTVHRISGSTGLFQLQIPAAWYTNPRPASTNLPVAICYITLIDTDKRSYTLPIMVTMYSGSDQVVPDIDFQTGAALPDVDTNIIWDIDPPSAVISSITSDDTSLQTVQTKSIPDKTMSFFVNDGNPASGTREVIGDFSQLFADVTAGAVPDGGITTAKLEDGAVTTDKVANGAITTDKIANSNVTTDKIADNAVTADKIADGVIPDAEIADGAVTTDKLADQAVTQEKLAFNSVGARELKENSVVETRIADAAVTRDKIENNAVDSSKIAADTISDGEIAANAVGAPELKDGAVGDDQLADAVKAKLLPTFPAEGSRDNKVPKFDGNTLGWEEDASGGGGGGGTDQTARNDAAAAQTTADAANTRANDNTRAIRNIDDVSIPRVEGKADANTAKVAVLENQIILELIESPFYGGNNSDIIGTYHLSAHIVAGAYASGILAQVYIQNTDTRLVQNTFTPGNAQDSFEFEINSATADNLFVNNHLTVGNTLTLQLRIIATGNNELVRKNLIVPIVAKPATAPDVDQTARDAAAAAQRTATSAQTTADSKQTAAQVSTAINNALAPTVQTLTPAATIDWDFDDGEQADLVLNRNAVLEISNGVDGDVAILRVTQDATGGRVLTLDTLISVNGRGAPVLSTPPRERDFLAFLKTGRTWTCLGIIKNDG